MQRMMMLIDDAVVYLWLVRSVNFVSSFRMGYPPCYVVLALLVQVGRDARIPLVDY